MTNSTRFSGQIGASIGISVTVAIALVTPRAWADGQVALGGGAGISVNGTDCTLTTIGHDGAGDLVGFTSAHCGGTGSQIVADGAENHGTVGTVTSTDGALAYAVIKFDPAKVAPTANFAGFPIKGIGPDPSFQQPVCTQGSATGQGCGVIASATIKAGIVGARVPAWQPGDFGAPLTVDDQLVGQTQNGSNVVQPALLRVIMHTNFTLFSAIMNDVNAKGGPGAGFTPIPA
jgi:hypothetical protein